MFCLSLITVFCLFVRSHDPIGGGVWFLGAPPLPSVSPVIVSFLPDGGNGSVRVCEVEKEQMKCGAAYSHRADLQQHSLELRKLSMKDSGTFSVIMSDTQRTVSVLFIHVFSAGTSVLL